MNNKSFPADSVYWYLPKKPTPRRLDKDLKVDALVIGGGMAGLSCAQTLRSRNLKVALLEKTFCGGGASGKTSGFITPDSELELSDMLRNYGPEKAKKLWSFGIHGVDIIRSNIEKFSLDCDFQKQDSLYIANDAKGFTNVEEEYRAREELEYSSTVYRRPEIQSVIGSEDYFGGIRYPDTFGMNSFLYCQGMKEQLQNMGVMVYEETPISHINDHSVSAGTHTISADNIVLCLDRFAPPSLARRPDTYQVQTFLAISKPLTDATVRKIFPKEKMMVWDTDLIYQYFRITGDNRLLVGAASMFYTYVPFSIHRSKHIVNKMYKYLTRKFPHTTFELDYLWPGILGVSRDFAPIAGSDARLPHVYFISGAAGLPWAAALGEYFAEKITTGRSELDASFSPTRKAPLNNFFGRLLPRPLGFALANGMSKYFKK